MDSRKIKSYPVNIYKTHDGIVLARGVFKSKIIGQNIYETVIRLLFLSQENLTYEQIISSFYKEERAIITCLINELIQRNILYFAGDSKNDSISTNPEDIFYWHFKKFTDEQKKSYSKIRLLVIGINALSKYLIQSLSVTGFNNFKIIEDPELTINNTNGSTQNHVLNDNEKYNCVIATSDFNHKSRLSYWNSLCLRQDWHFFPIALDNIIGFLGPYIIPKHTPCYDCFLARENANFLNCDYLNYEFQKNISHTNGYHPLMPLILANLAVMELVRIHTEFLPNSISKLTHINFITQEMRAHKILRIPRCKTCYKPT